MRTHLLFEVSLRQIGPARRRAFLGQQVNALCDNCPSNAVKRHDCTCTCRGDDPLGYALEGLCDTKTQSGRGPLAQASMRCSAATRTRKNSSRLLEKIPRNRIRSIKGTRSSSASCSTRSLNDNQLSSRLKNSSSGRNAGLAFRRVNLGLLGGHKQRRYLRPSSRGPFAANNSSSLLPFRKPSPPHDHASANPPQNSPPLPSSTAKWSATSPSSSYRDQYVVLFFYPEDFTSVCGSEVHAFQERLSDFADREAAVIGCSTNSATTHLQFLKTPKADGGAKG